MHSYLFCSFLGRVWVGGFFYYFVGSKKKQIRFCFCHNKKAFGGELILGGQNTWSRGSESIPPTSIFKQVKSKIIY